MPIHKTTRFVRTSFVAAVLLMALAGIPAQAQEKGKAITKVLIDNDKVRVIETRYRPGDVGEEDRSAYRVNRTLQGGTLQRIYPDGRTDTVQLKTGTVRYIEPSKAGNFKVKNIGKTVVVAYVVRLK